MPVDYSKWAHVLQGEVFDLDDGQGKEWSEMSIEERQAASRRADAADVRLQETRREHERYLEGITQDAENTEDSWMYDVNLDSYQDFTIKRTWRVVKTRGAEYFKAGHYDKAEQHWLGGLQLVQKVGTTYPTATELLVQLKCNLAQLYVKTERWAEAKNAASGALEADPKCEKALYRRALARMHFAEWAEARRDLERLLALYPRNSEAQKLLAEAGEALRRQGSIRRAASAAQQAGDGGGAGGLELSNAMEELTPDGTLRKLAVLVAGLEELEGEARRWNWPWGREEWLGNSRQKAVLAVHVVVRSVGGEELFNTRSRAVLPETPQERDELRWKMQQIAELDDLAGKMARTPDDFCPREALQPMRWRYGDPCVYAGFDLAARSMRLGERALFEIDQPLLEPSVSAFYQQDGGAARVAGLPNFRHHVEERKLNLLAEELPEWELDLESKTQRTVRAELELLSIDLFEDLSQGRSGEYLIRVADAGRGGRRLVKGTKVQGDFVVAGALDGTALYRVEKAIWIIGEEGQESYVNRHGQRSVWIPACIGRIFQDAVKFRPLLYEGTRLEARLQVGPAPMELNPQLAKDLSAKRAWGHKPPVAVAVDITCIMDE